MLPEEIYVFDPSGVASKLMKNIVDYAGVSLSKLKLQASNVPNALAYVDPVSNAKLILYNEDFVSELEGTTGSAWTAKAILAHELGHHLNDHLQLVDSARRRVEELEADKFAGHVLFKMGASLEAVTKVFKGLAEGEDYPPSTARVTAATSGWWSAKEQSGYQGDHSPQLTKEQQSEVREGKIASPPESPPPVDAPASRELTVDDFRLEIVQQGSMVSHAGGTLAPGPGLSFRISGKLTLPAADVVGVSVHFAFSDGRPLAPYPTEFRYRDGAVVATGFQFRQLAPGIVDLATLPIDPIPYYALNLTHSGFQQSYALTARAYLLVGPRSAPPVGQSAPVQFLVQW